MRKRRWSVICEGELHGVREETSSTCRIYLGDHELRSAAGTGEGDHKSSEVEVKVEEAKRRSEAAQILNKLKQKTSG